MWGEMYAVKPNLNRSELFKDIPLTKASDGLLVESFSKNKIILSNHNLSFLFDSQLPLTLSLQ
jgi:hypothetical protein